MLKLNKLWNDQPLLVIIILAVLPRLIAAFFSKGYGMHDDHFGPIEQPFIIKHDITYWSERNEPHGHSIVYPAIHLVIFKGCDSLGINDPQDKMLVVRLIHAIYSLLIVVFGYKIAFKLSGAGVAKLVGVILALFWGLPFLGVRNLIEVVSSPLIMVGFYYSIKSEDKWKWMLAGLFFGLAFSFRYQTLIIPATIFMILFWQKEYLSGFKLVVSYFLTTLIVQGSFDIFAWGYPFAGFITYFFYNSAHADSYTSGPWYNYILLMIGLLLPPVSLLLIYGFGRIFKKYYLIILPVLAFFIFHSAFPNKQERFIFPILPIIITMSVIGFKELTDSSSFWQSKKWLIKSVWIYFFVINNLLLIVFSLNYTKRTRVESMYYLYNKPVNSLIISTGKVGTFFYPLFYADKYPIKIFDINNFHPIDSTIAKLKADSVNKPNYAIFFSNDQLTARTSELKNNLPINLTFEKEIEPSLIDNLLYYLNPKYNINQTSYIYSIKWKQ